MTINKDVIIACDFDSSKELDVFLKKINTKKVFLKIGYQLFYKIGPEGIKKYKKQGYKIFLDLKLHDIPNTVKMGVKSLADLNIDFLTIHAAGGINMMKAAKEYCKKTKILAVTQLTSIDQKTLKNELLINKNIQDVVLKYASNAYKAGLDGVVCSVWESKLIHSKISKNFLTICPGIRYQTTQAHDQKRVADPKTAKKETANYVVVGREITKSPNPKLIYQKIINDFFN